MLKKPLKVIDAKYYGIKFEDLLAIYPNLKDLLMSENNQLDLGNPHVLSTLNEYLFRHLLELKIVVPTNYLIPAMSLRLAYIEGIKQFFNHLPIIEIGTGASAALSLIAAKKYNQTVIATEINAESYKSAKENIVNNNLSSNITVIKSEGQVIKDFLPTGEYSVLLTYPPIYSNDLTILEKKRGWKGTQSELIGGGKDGLEFCKQLIDEALSSPKCIIRVISLMIMNKQQLTELINYCKQNYDYIKIKAGTRFRYVLLLYINI